VSTYESAVNRLLALGHELASNRKFDLAHMRRLAEALGNPQRKLQSVLIAGTNGKRLVIARGSTPRLICCA
jgi:dihydrofolate synthase / folylpolyglutamate synthase